MQNFGGALGVFIIIVVTLAQLAGKNKRANKGERRSEADGPRDDMELLRRPQENAGNNDGSKSTWNRKLQKQRKIKGAKADSAGKIAAEESTTSFEVDGGRHDDVQGFDVK